MYTFQTARQKELERIQTNIPVNTSSYLVSLLEAKHEMKRTD